MDKPEKKKKPGLHISTHARKRYVERILGGVAPGKRRLDKEILAFVQVHPEKCVIKKKNGDFIIATILE